MLPHDDMEDNKNKYSADFYWDTVLLEAQNRHIPGYSFIFTNLEHQSTGVAYPQGKAYPKFDPQQFPIYYVDDKAAPTPLTRREGECLTHLAKGKTVKSTAKHLGLSPRTIEYYSNRIKEKLDCRNKNELVRKINLNGLIKKTGKHKEQVIPPQKALDS